MKKPTPSVPPKTPTANREEELKKRTMENETREREERNLESAVSKPFPTEAQRSKDFQTVIDDTGPVTGQVERENTTSGRDDSEIPVEEDREHQTSQKPTPGPLMDPEKPSIPLVDPPTDDRIGPTLGPEGYVPSRDDVAKGKKIERDEKEKEDGK